MSRIASDVKDGSMKSEFNQSDPMLSMMEDCQRARAGWGKPWARVTPAYRDNYDAIEWDCPVAKFDTQ